MGKTPDCRNKKGIDWLKTVEKWQQAERERKIYRIENNNCYACQGGGCPVCGGFGVIQFIIGSIHEAEVNEETLTAIIL